MIDAAIISASISGVVSLISTYIKHRLDTQQSQQPVASVPSTEELAQIEKGGQALTVVKSCVDKHGNEDEQADLGNFERNPLRYQDALRQALLDLASREPSVASQIEELAGNLDAQTGSAQGTVNISGKAKVFGPAIGVMSGNLTGVSYHIDDNESKED